jgi:hypothetical protein
MLKACWKCQTEAWGFQSRCQEEWVELDLVEELLGIEGARIAWSKGLLRRARIESVNVLDLLGGGGHSIIESGWLGVGDLDCNAIINGM